MIVEIAARTAREDDPGSGYGTLLRGAWGRPFSLRGAAEGTPPAAPRAPGSLQAAMAAAARFARPSSQPISSDAASPADALAVRGQQSAQGSVGAATAGGPGDWSADPSLAASDRVTAFDRAAGHERLVGDPPAAAEAVAQFAAPAQPGAVRPEPVVAPAGHDAAPAPAGPASIRPMVRPDAHPALLASIVDATLRGAGRAASWSASRRRVARIALGTASFVVIWLLLQAVA